MKIESNSSLITNQLKSIPIQKIVAEVNPTNTQPENRVIKQSSQNLSLIDFTRQACKVKTALLRPPTIMKKLIDLDQILDKR